MFNIITIFLVDNDEKIIFQTILELMGGVKSQTKT